MVPPLGHKVHRAVDGLLLVLRDGQGVVEIPLEHAVQVVHDEDVRVDVHHVVHLTALRNQLLQEAVARGPVIQVVVRVAPKLLFVDHYPAKGGWPLSWPADWRDSVAKIMQ